MRLLNIRTENYRTLQKTEINFSSSYCTISGKNNAGKSCVIRLLLNLLQKESIRPWIEEDFYFNYKEDKTQWLKDQNPITIIYAFELAISDDPALISFISKISEQKIQGEKVELEVEMKVQNTNEIETSVKINNHPVSKEASIEILKKLKTSNLLFHHNSTDHEEIYYGKGRRKALYEIVLSEDERKQLDEAAKTLQRKVKRLAREHREHLNSLLGKLSESYDVEFSTVQRYVTRQMFGINLRDKNVEIPLNDWGSGTQNRTYILISILQANRIKTKESSQDKTTPIVVVEEPESFLHPSAQAEFGHILRSLSAELGIQIIVTTHSPYMLNQQDPTSNILVGRKLKKRRLLESRIVDTSGEDWMAPFAEHLGLEPSEFKNWKAVFSSDNTSVLLVEGDTDKEYFEFLRNNNLGKEVLPNDIKIVPYGGKDALKNTVLLKFALSNFGKFFITFDLDASDSVKKSLEGFDLKAGIDYLGIGLEQSGKEAIEGLLPERILSAVYGKETDLVMQSQSTNSDARRNAKSKLKRKLLDEFVKHKDYTDNELKELSKIVKIVNQKFEKP